MIKKIEIQNFQAHDDTTLDLSPGVNIIAGVSDSGKSSILRACKWLILNKPVGSHFQSDFVDKDKVKTIVKFTVDNQIFTRSKDKSFNGYIYSEKIVHGSVDIKEAFEALKGDVPDKFKEELNLSTLNIQSQHDGHFLLNDTAGDVAKKLNQLVGLDIIDLSLKNINTIVKSANQEASNATNSAIEKEQAISRYKNVDDLLVQVSVIEKILFDLNKHKESQNKLQQIIERVSWAEKDIKKFTSKIETETGLNIIIELIKDQEETEEIEAELQSAITNLQSVNEIIKRDTALTDNVNKINKILELDKKAETLSVKTKNLEPLIEQVNNLSGIVSECEYKIKEQTKKYDLKMKSLKICPLCNQKIKG